MARILVVDDSPMDRTLISGLLEKGDDLEVELANDGQQALQMVRDRPPDLVLTDMMMPELDGLELVRLLGEQNPLVPVVLITGKGSEELAVEALRAGAASYVSKRRLNTDLLETVEQVLSAVEHRQRQAKLMQGLVSQSCVFEIRSDQSLLRPLITYLQEQLARVGFGCDNERTRIGVALEEAMNNALEHGNLEIDSRLREVSFDRYLQCLQERQQQSPYKDRTIRVEATIAPHHARFMIRDQGAGFDPTTLPDPKAPENIEKASGRGILLMRTFMDEVVFSDRGNQVDLLKRAGGDSVSPEVA